MTAKTKPKPGHGGSRPGAGRKPHVGATSAGPFSARAVLEAIAADPLAPPTARVSAARALLSLDKHAPDDSDGAPVDPLSRRAIELMAGNGRAN
jgi:hypothetical protein